MQTNSEICGSPLITFDTLPSTNTYIKEHADKLADRTVVIADMQSSGKGRIGNKWLATRDMLPISILIKAPRHIAARCSVFNNSDFYILT